MSNKEYSREYRQKHKDEFAEKSRKYKKEHREDIKEYYQKNKDKIIEKSRKYYQKNKDKIIEKSRKYYQKNKDKIKKVTDRYKQNHRDEILLTKRKYGKTQRAKELKKIHRQKEEKIQIKARRQNYLQKYPEKQKARSLARAIKIPNNQICQTCKVNRATEKHHEDYSKPLEVMFLCNGCHNKLNRKYNDG